MDDRLIDRLARIVAAPRSRRTILKAVAGLLIGRRLGTASLAAAMPGNCTPVSPCIGDDNTCFGDFDIEGSCACLQSGNPKMCATAGPCTTNAECGDGDVCRQADCNDGTIGRCWNICFNPQPCPDGQTQCGDKCYDLTNDASHCGGCTANCNDGELLPGYKPDECVNGVCVEVCTDNADHCGGSCTDFQVDFSNCGGCGNVCADDHQCCGGRCVSASDSQRFCDGCGSYPGWPQGCDAGEACMNGLCIPSTAPTATDSAETPPDTGLLAYAVKNSGHWDVWVHDLAAATNVQLTNLPKSDQWAPAWSHDGKRLAYLSDQIDGTDQVWIMDPDGKNQTQLTKHTGSETIAYVAWSPKDDELIVTLRGSRGDRLVTMPAAGGKFTDYKPVPASFASTSPLGQIAYVTVVNGANAVRHEAWDSTANGIEGTAAIAGTTLDAPNIDIGGHDLIVQKGEKGSRRLEIFSDRFAPNEVPAVGTDDSNPVWTNKGFVFVSSDGTTESLIYMPFAFDQHFVLPIAPHDEVWYLAARLLLPS